MYVAKCRVASQLPRPALRLSVTPRWPRHLRTASTKSGTKSTTSWASAPTPNWHKPGKKPTKNSQKFCAVKLRLVQDKSLNDPRKADIPTLARGLNAVLDSPGPQFLRDPRTGHFNFPDTLHDILPVENFDFEALGPYVTSSRDVKLGELSKRHGAAYYSSTSSMTSVLSKLHLLLSKNKPIKTDHLFSASFPEPFVDLTRAYQMPASVFVSYNPEFGTHAIDNDRSFDHEIVLSLLGHSLEKFLTLEDAEYRKFYKNADKGKEKDENENENDEKSENKGKHNTDSDAGTETGNSGTISVSSGTSASTSESSKASESSKSSKSSKLATEDAYHYSKTGSFILRSQLDCRDPKLPNFGTFDLKTRAVCAVRYDLDHIQYTEPTAYEIRRRTGLFESFEREMFDLCRSTLIKYSLQARIGHMCGIYLAYHNVQRMFGFQYLPLADMDMIVHGFGIGVDANLMSQPSFRAKFLRRRFVPAVVPLDAEVKSANVPAGPVAVKLTDGAPRAFTPEFFGRRNTETLARRMWQDMQAEPVVPAREISPDFGNTPVEEADEASEAEAEAERESGSATQVSENGEKSPDAEVKEAEEEWAKEVEEAEEEWAEEVKVAETADDVDPEALQAEQASAAPHAVGFGDAQKQTSFIEKLRATVVREAKTEKAENGNSEGVTETEAETEAVPLKEAVMEEPTAERVTFLADAEYRLSVGLLGQFLDHVKATHGLEKESFRLILTTKRVSEIENVTYMEAFVVPMTPVEIALVQNLGESEEAAAIEMARAELASAKNEKMDWKKPLGSKVKDETAANAAKSEPPKGSLAAALQAISQPLTYNGEELTEEVLKRELEIGDERARFILSRLKSRQKAVELDNQIASRVLGYTIVIRQRINGKPVPKNEYPFPQSERDDWTVLARFSPMQRAKARYKYLDAMAKRRAVAYNEDVGILSEKELAELDEAASVAEAVEVADGGQSPVPEAEPSEAAEAAAAERELTPDGQVFSHGKFIRSLRRQSKLQRILRGFSEHHKRTEMPKGERNSVGHGMISETSNHRHV